MCLYMTMTGFQEIEEKCRGLEAHIDTLSLPIHSMAISCCSTSPDSRGEEIDFTSCYEKLQTQIAEGLDTKMGREFIQ